MFEGARDEGESAKLKMVREPLFHSPDFYRGEVKKVGDKSIR